MRRSAELPPAVLHHTRLQAQAYHPRWRTVVATASEPNSTLADSLGLASLLLVVVLTLVTAPALEQRLNRPTEMAAMGDDASAVVLVSPLSLPDEYGNDSTMPGLTAELPALPSEPEPQAEASALLQTLDLDALGEDIGVFVHEKSIGFRIRSETLFASGQTKLASTGVAVLDRLAAVLQHTNSRIAIEGHSDTVPIRTAQFPSNWELSASRAASVLRHLQTRGIAPERLRATGYADTRPIAENDTPAGRAANRRVELVMEMTPNGAS